MIHADLHPKNFVVSKSGALHVIDFDDAVLGGTSTSWRWRYSSWSKNRTLRRSSGR